MKRILALLLLAAPAMAQYTPTYGINMAAAGARETFQPKAYFITDSANFKTGSSGAFGS